MNELDELIKSIPMELSDCFYIKIGNRLANEIIKELSIYNYEKIDFPCTYKKIQVVKNQRVDKELFVIPNKECYFKVYNYEIKKVKEFLNEYEKLCNKYNLSIGACDCCDSPYLDDDFYTINIRNINYDEGKLSYNIEYSYEASKYLK